MNTFQSPPLPHLRMGDMADNDGRPTKRMKLASNAHAANQQMPTDISAFDSISQTDGINFAWPVSPALAPAWSWTTAPIISAPGDLPLPVGPHDIPTTWAPELGVSPQMLQQPTTTSASSSFELSPTTLSFDSDAIFSQQSSNDILPPPPPPPLAYSAPMTDVEPPRPQTKYSQPAAAVSKTLVSPFTDCIDTFGSFNSPRFQRPMDGQVNGYVKFNWPRKRERESGFVEELPSNEPPNKSVRTESPPVKTRETSVPTININDVTNPMAVQRRASAAPIMVSSGSSGNTSPMYSPTLSTKSFDGVIQIHAGEEPRLIPPHFGHEARMDPTDRGLWKFYINNWCPGRSVLGKTNLWLTDFAKMHRSDGVLAAIQSLAGIYVYDYQPNSLVRKRVNDRFAQAEGRFTQLLRATDLIKEEVSELITIASILSMQDIVLVERRLKRPHEPRWLKGFKQCEYLLQQTDPGSRFWNTENVQLDNLRVSQSVIVGRAVILAQPMMPLPTPETFDPKAEAARFGWLMYGTRGEVHEIHGGCGFSKRLLHAFSQITYCAGRLNQDPKTPVVPVTAKGLYRSLSEMRQWSSESLDWETTKLNGQPIDWIRKVPEHYTISTSQQMTDATGEAWRFAALLYLQCRLLRYPRNHPEVLSNVADLAKTIAVMPTSGYHFTAQAPLFPVFLLGLLAVQPEHRGVSTTWFESVVSTPVRSSVPPLYNALKRIRHLLDSEVKSSVSTVAQLPNEIAARPQWWESLMTKLEEYEEEVLCLT